MPVVQIVKRKAKRMFPAAVEGRFFKRMGVAWKQTKTWVDRSIGYENRKVLSQNTPVVHNRIMFITFNHSYSCNPKYICEELIKRNANVEIYWGVTNMNTRGYVPDLPNVHVVKMNSYEYFVAACSSHVIIINSLLGDKFYPFPVKKEQRVFETWHGSLGIKRFDLAHYNTNLSWPEAAIRTGKLTNYCISNSKFEEDVFRETFWPETRIMRLGHARNDIFFDTYKEKRAQWKKEFFEERGLDPETKLCLYAPTFRDTHNFEVYDLNCDRLVEALEERFGGEWKILLRYHDNDKKKEKTQNKLKQDCVIDVTDLPDIQELLSFVDCGITDYSSWIYDFVLSGKPGFIYARDVEIYNNERGFYFKLEESPFPVAKCNDEMMQNVRSFDEKLYADKVKEFLDGKECMDDGHASERIADRLMKLLG
ncbi:CDP-glycerol glycerophosphotransferase family protein [Butyrivibrio fibrisolvens]|uniref:CDP-glycerol glycerophosphotransferase family protein n=1 Tax=Butyrivibrio fibrisolvens TaxID=831 RepID=UPI000408C2FF|nr:CDP-glycerol glycerophosphotransferase family protein [Butyrivibrio fibrisolvens]